MDYGKRGETRTLFWIMELIMGVAIVAVLVNGGISHAKGIEMIPVYLANDLAATMNALHAVGGNVVYAYPERLDQWRVRFERGEVKVYPAGQKIVHVNKKYTPIQDSSLQEEIVGEELYLGKVGNEVLADTRPLSFSFTSCPLVDTAGTPETIAVVSERQNELTNILLQVCPTCTANIEQAGVILHLKQGLRKNPKAIVQVDARSEKLGCLIANSIAKEQEGEANVYKALEKGPRTVHIEVSGNPQETAQAIMKGINQYYARASIVPKIEIKRSGGLVTYSS